jgi:hypothetical protein
MPWTTATTRTAGFSVTATVWNNEHVDNMNFLKRVGFQTYTSDVTVTATTVATAVQIVTLGAITYENVPHMLEFYSPYVNPPAAQAFFILRDSTTVLGTIARTSATGDDYPLGTIRYPITPTAASHTYNIAAWLSGAGTLTVNAGSGGTAGDDTTDLNGYMAAYRVPT